MNKPKVFISSTIEDFKDLRSAIKYYLEKNNFEVATSENADFPNDLTLDNFNACILQYIVLLKTHAEKLFRVGYLILRRFYLKKGSKKPD